nr:MAG TPA: hypothetical protein [Caudoviricetes sp.]
MGIADLPCYPIGSLSYSSCSSLPTSSDYLLLVIKPTLALVLLCSWHFLVVTPS